MQSHSFVYIFIYFIYFFIYFSFLWPHLWHMEVLGSGVESELQLLACTTATAMPDLSHNYDLCHSLWQHWIFTPLSKARDRTRILVDTS